MRGCASPAIATSVEASLLRLTQVGILLAFVLLPLGVRAAASLGHASATLPRFEAADTLELYMGGRAVGTLMQRLYSDSVSGGFVDQSTVSATLAETPGLPDQDVVIAERRCYRASDGRLTQAEQSVQSAAGFSSWLLRREAGTWRMVVTAGGQSTAKDVAGVFEEILSTLDQYRRIRAGSVALGDRWVDTAFELTSATSMVSTATCVELPAPGNGQTYAFRVHDDFSGRDEQWVMDRAGRTLLRSVPPIFVGRARGYVGRPDTGTVTARSLSEILSVPVAPRPAPDEVVVVSVDSGAELHASARVFYRREPGGWVLQPVIRQCDDAIRPLADDSTLLRPTPTMQSGDERIRSLAAGIAPREKRLCRLVLALNTYVHATIRKRNIATFSSALETLSAGFGDCGEHAVLLGALLRSRGVAARVVLGLVYMDDKRAYLGHAWVAVKTDKGWLFADPALGHFPAGDGLVPLVVDDYGDKAIYALNVVGRIRIQYRGGGK
jgi:transglutaminase-like putative cysteine protease